MVNWNEELTKAREPYHFQRDRGRLSSYARPAQPNTYQPNALMQVWGVTTRDYWNNIFMEYLKRRKSSPDTNLTLGRLR